MLILLLAGCGGTSLTLPPEYIAEHNLKFVEPASPELLHAFESGLNKEYLLGPGDVVEIVAPVHPEIAGEQIISPEGQMTVYPDGGLQVAGLTRAEAEKRLKGAMTRYYNPPAMTLRIKSFENNQVLVLGKVTTPGVVKFKSRPNLLEALARSGAFPAGAQERRMSRCDIIRGKDQILRVSIDELLRGGASGRNLDLANNDIVYIPENEDNNVYVMGEVAKPGAYEIRTSMTLLNALMLAGGPNETAVTNEILLVRDHGKETAPLKINLDRIVDSSDFAGNVVLAKNDIVFVPRRGIATFNYYLRMINPFTTLIFFGTTATKK
jgi:polysaccharide export outer membrane protein